MNTPHERLDMAGASRADVDAAVQGARIQALEPLSLPLPPAYFDQP